MATAAESAKQRKSFSEVDRRRFKRLRVFRSKKAKDYNASDMELVFSEVWSSRWPNTPAAMFTIRDKKHAKDLIAHYGAETTAFVIREVVTHWEQYRADLKMNGFPSMIAFYGYRNSLFPMVLEQDSKGMKPGWGSHFEEGDSTDSGDEMGWPEGF